MDRETHIEVWDKASDLLRAEMSPVSFDAWITTLRPIQFTGDSLLLECGEEPLHRSMVSKYVTLIGSAVNVSAGRRVNLQFLTEKEAAARLQRAQTEGKAGSMTTLNPRYTFDTFVVGNSNRFARAAALAVAEAPTEAYNPLFIYGGVGLGKTHLMHAIGHFIQQQTPSTQLLYISSESFTNELISAIQKNKNAEFRERFRNVDVLMVDDIQFIAGRDSTQEEFFHTFNALHTANKQIVISSDRPPNEIARLEERLVSRFQWGLIADVQRPDVETRNAILRKKAETDRIEVTDEVIHLIAERIDSNIRELEGSLTRVVAYAQLAGKPITPQLAQDALRDISTVKDPKRITCSLIQQAVAEYCSVTIQDLKSNKRNRGVTAPRQIAMFLTREMTGDSLLRIGDEFGGRDHSTVIHACEKIAEELTTNPSVKLMVEDLRRVIHEK
ncbi:MAG: chromosomal replication initiator protein DnaA [Oscillospiraceae bacterium]|jgi:chromosomal replication initiator protein|nr:chromosomal replication initiator protein DnaA [Oscillospiraceae bacterium]